jgi:hypothetical protein
MGMNYSKRIRGTATDLEHRFGVDAQDEVKHLRKIAADLEVREATLEGVKDAMTDLLLADERANERADQHRRIEPPREWLTGFRHTTQRDVEQSTYTADRGDQLRSGEVMPNI